MTFDLSFTVTNRVTLCVGKFEGHGIPAVYRLGRFSTLSSRPLYFCVLYLCPASTQSCPAAEPFPPAPLARPQHTSCLSLSALGLFGEIKN